MTVLDPHGPAMPHEQRLGRMPAWARYERQLSENVYEYETAYMTRAALLDIVNCRDWNVRVDPVNYDAIRITFTRKNQ